MNSGELREQITIQKPIRAADGSGGFTTTWAALATVWARVQPIKGRFKSLEGMDAAKLKNQMEYMVTIRYRADVTDQMRILWGVRKFEIYDQYNSDERKQYLTLECNEWDQNDVSG